MFVIIGASGYLGSYLIKNIIENTQEKVIATYNNFLPKDSLKSCDRIEWFKLDISDSHDVEKFYKNKLSENIKYKIVYLAAYHHPDKVEENPKRAWNINVACLDYFLNIAKSKIDSLYYSSTDSIYGESVNGNIFNENDSYNPANTYGRTKSAAEQIVLMHGFSVIRYSLLMGPSLIEKKHFYDVIVDSLNNNTNIDMFVDSSRSIISFDKAAFYTIKLLNEYYKKQDIINVTSDINMTKFDMAVKIARKLNLDHQFIKPVSIVQKNEFGTKRAKNTLISNKKLKNILNIKNIYDDL